MKLCLFSLLSFISALPFENQGNIDLFHRIGQAEIVVFEACESGSIETALSFLGPNATARVPFYPLETLEAECLERAAAKGHLALIHATGIADNFAIDLRDQFNAKAMVKALENNHFAVVNYLVSQFPLEEHQDIWAFLFAYASCSGNLKALKQILSSGFLELSDIQAAKFEEFAWILPVYEPLECAAANGHEPVVRFLLNLREKGAPLSVEYNDNAAIRLAMSHNEPMIFRLLVPFAERVPIKDLDLGLLDAVSGGNLEMVQWMLGCFEMQNLTVNAEYEMELKAHSATADVLHLMLEMLGDRLFIDGFDIAASAGRLDVLGVYFDSPWIDQFSPIIFGKAIQDAGRNGHTETIHALLERFGDIITSNQLQTALLYAAEQGKTDTLKFLLSLDIFYDPDHVQKVFLYVIQSGNINAIKLIVESCGIDPSANQNAAFATAIRTENLEIVQYIVSLHSQFPGIDPSHDRNDALMFAVKKNYFKLVYYLVSIRNQFPGINPADRDNFAIKYARKYGLCHIVDFLLSLPPEMGIDHRIALMDPSDIILVTRENAMW